MDALLSLFLHWNIHTSCRVLDENVSCAKRLNGNVCVFLLNPKSLTNQTFIHCGSEVGHSEEPSEFCVTRHCHSWAVGKGFTYIPGMWTMNGLLMSHLVKYCLVMWMLRWPQFGSDKLTRAVWVKGLLAVCWPLPHTGPNAAQEAARIVPLTSEAKSNDIIWVLVGGKTLSLWQEVICHRWRSRMTLMVWIVLMWKKSSPKHFCFV